MTSPPGGERWTCTAPSAESSRRCGTSPVRSWARLSTRCWAGNAETGFVSMRTAGPAAPATPDQLAEKAVQVVETGYSALKFDPIPGPWRTFVSREVERATVDNVRAVREAVGSDVDILLDMHRRLAPMHAIRIAREIESYDPFWYEEPVLAENVDALAAAKREIDIPVVTGEELYTKFDFREVFEKQAADIINPDVANVGGILELKEIAAMAEAYFVAVAPHNSNTTTVALAATLQLAAIMPNFLLAECFINLEEFGRKIAVTPFEVVNGYVALCRKRRDWASTWTWRR